MIDESAPKPYLEPPKLTDWKQEPTILQLKQDFEDAKTEADNHVKDVDYWLDNLHVRGSAKLRKRKNRSGIQPKLIRKQAEWRYSSLSEPFLSTDDLFNASPVTAEDRQSSWQNQLVLNHQFNHQINKVGFIDEYIRTAVDEGTVIVRTGWHYEEEEVDVEQPRYEERVNTDPDYLAQLQQWGVLFQQDPEAFAQQVSEEIVLSVQRSLERQQPVQVIQVGTQTVIETKVKYNRPTAEVCDYRDIIIDPTCRGDLSKAKFVIYRFTTSLEELEARGIYNNLEYINVSGNSPLNESDEFQSPDNHNFNFKDKPRTKFVAYEYWGFRDIDGSGQVKPIVGTWVGDVIIRMENNPFPDQELPFVTVPYLPVRKSLYGEPDGELIIDNQNVIGALSRGMIDIMAANAAGQRGYRKDALDAVNRQRYMDGQDYEFNPNVDPRQAFHVQTFAEIPASAQFMYGQQNMEAESFTGVKAFADGISGRALGDTATGVRSALDAASKRELGILRRLADGIIKIGHKFVSMNAEFLSDGEIIRVTNEEFIAINREELAGKFDLKLSISTAEEDNAKAQELAFMLQTTGPNGDPGEVRMMRAEIARLRKMPDLAKRIEEYQPQPDPIAQEKAQLENDLLRAQIQETLAESQQRAATAREKDSQADLNSLDFVEQESGVKQERELEKQGEQARSNAKLEMIKQAISPNSSGTSNQN